MHSIDDASVALPIRCVYNVCHGKKLRGQLYTVKPFVAAASIPAQYTKYFTALLALSVECLPRAIAKSDRNWCENTRRKTVARLPLLGSETAALPV